MTPVGLDGTVMAAAGHDRPLVAIVVVGYNDKRIVSECLESLKKLDYRPMLVIYVDNASPDASLEHIQIAFPAVVAIPSGGNLGYCGGNNVGIVRAMESGAKFVLILNPDTVVCNRDFVSELVDYMNLHPDVGKVGPKVYLRQYGNVQNTILNWPSITGSFCSVLATVCGLGKIPKSATVKLPMEVPSLNGCCLLVRVEAIRAVGGYDPTFWCYMDEVDWDWQAERAGWKRHYVPIESIIHLQKESGYDFASQANYYIKRNTALWYAKTGNYISMIAWMVITLAIAVCRAISAPLFCRSPAKYAAFVSKLGKAYAEVTTRLFGGSLRESSGFTVSQANGR
jgi:N-acetylglucosaminyl-diphospho-decaprenol L-rhamnosyltransferase